MKTYREQGSSIINQAGVVHGAVIVVASALLMGVGVVGTTAVHRGQVPPNETRVRSSANINQEVSTSDTSDDTSTNTEDIQHSEPATVHAATKQASVIPSKSQPVLPAPKGPQNPVAEPTSGAPYTTTQFLDSLGVVAHLTDKDYPSSSVTLEKLKYLGVRHVRTNNAINSTEGVVTTKKLGQNGIRFDFTVPAPSGNPPSAGAIQTATDKRVNYVVDNGLAPYTELIETFNEYDNGRTTETWVNTIKQSQPYLYAQSTKLGSGIKIMGPSLVGYKLGSTASAITAAADGKPLSSYFSYGNLHTYFGYSAPESSYGDAQSGSILKPATSPTGAATNFDTRVQYYTYYISPDKPIIITETGYNTDAKGWSKGVSEKAAGIYTPRMFLEAYRIGVVRTYEYELYDEATASPSHEQHFGLFRKDGSPKPAAVALHNMTSLLAGGSDAFTPASLPVTFSGDTTGLKKVMLQKSDGEHWLMLWRGLPVYGSDHKDKDVAATNVSVNFSSPRSVTLYSGLTQTSPTTRSLGSVQSATIPLGPEVCLLKIQ